ncbi:MAG TPA: hypothetical protein PLS45_08370 [Bacillota bacterium]|nr:hypothetical protein [Bacillota bacterium]HPW41402.1 hypothetical protein [Bacillota bacterium]
MKKENVKRNREIDNYENGTITKKEGRQGDSKDESRSLVKGGFMNMENIGGMKIIGLKDFRNNVSDIIFKVINNFQVVLTGNVKKGGPTVSIISTDLLEDILEKYEFNPEITYDEETKQHEISLKEINAFGSGDTKEEAIKIVLDNVMALTEDFFEDIELYMRMDPQKKQYPYFMRISHCKTESELLKVLNLVQ